MSQYLLTSPITLLIVGGILATGGDILLKKWADKDVGMFSGIFGVSLGVYIIGILFLAQAFKLKGVATANAIFVAVNAVTLILAQVWYFGEKISALQFIGITMAVIGIVCIEIG